MRSLPTIHIFCVGSILTVWSMRYWDIPSYVVRYGLSSRHTVYKSVTQCHTTRRYGCSVYIDVTTLWPFISCTTKSLLISINVDHKVKALSIKHQSNINICRGTPLAIHSKAVETTIVTSKAFISLRVRPLSCWVKEKSKKCTRHGSPGVIVDTLSGYQRCCHRINRLPS